MMLYVLLYCGVHKTKVCPNNGTINWPYVLISFILRPTYATKQALGKKTWQRKNSLGRLQVRLPVSGCKHHILEI